MWPTSSTSAENVKQAAWMNAAPAVILNIQRQPGANIIDVVDRIKALLPQLQASLPAAVKVTILTDRTTTIRASVADVEFELMLTVALVVMVIFLFLRSFAATVIPSVAVPLSLVGTFGVMYLLGYSLNNLTLMALTISTGFVVDDAIVMIENISRYIEEGRTAAGGGAEGRGADRIHDPVAERLADRGADSAAVHGRHRRAAVPRIRRSRSSVTILVSAVVSLTLTPMMCGEAAAPHAGRASRGGSTKRRSASSIGSSRFTARTLRWVLRHQLATLLVAVATLVLTIFLYMIMPKGFFPVQDTGVILGVSEAPQTVSFAAMAQRQQALAHVILKDPGGGKSVVVHRHRRHQHDDQQRADSDQSEAAGRAENRSRGDHYRLQPKLAQVEGITLYMQPVQDLTVEDRVSRTQYQYSLEDPDPAELSDLGPAADAQAEGAARAARRGDRPAERGPAGCIW